MNVLKKPSTDLISNRLKTRQQKASLRRLNGWNLNITVIIFTLPLW